MVRTHYGADLEEAYDALVQSHIIGDRALNDRVLYDGLDTAQLLLRLPQLVDQQTAHIIEDAERWEIADREGSPPYEELAEDSFDKPSGTGSLFYWWRIGRPWRRSRS